MVDRLLITTALEETWKFDKPVLFLGEWCKNYSNRDDWSKLDEKTLSYHWDDRKKLFDDYCYLQKLYEKLLADLSVQLNEYHSTNYSLRFWRILVGPWLGYFIQVLFDRWETVRLAIEKYNISGTIVLEAGDEAFVPSDMGQFLNLFINDKWNHYVYSYLILNHTKIETFSRECGDEYFGNEATSTITWKQKLKRIIIDSINSILNVFGKKTDAFFLKTYLPVFDEVKLNIALRQIPRLWQTIKPNNSFVDLNKRKWNLEGGSDSEFETCLRKFIPLQIPINYLEGFNELVEQVKTLPWPSNPKLIWTSNSYIGDDVFKLWTGMKTESGTPLAIGQHGGGHGINLFSYHEEHQLDICNIFLSWGWSDKEQKKIRPVGEINGKKALGINHAQKQKALLVTMALPRQSYHMYSVVVSRQWLDYFEDQCRFVNALPDHIRASLLVRLFSHDFGWEQELRWKNAFPDLDYDDGTSSINSKIKQSRVLISTYNATTFLESFSMNVPTIMYWNPDHWEVKDSAVPYFHDLKDVGIFHETPESAARQLSVIWDDVNAWWNSIPVRGALNNFKSQYCNMDGNTLSNIKKEFDTIIDAH